MVQNPEDIKEQILSVLKTKGPSLPVHIAGEIKSSILFSSAFLGELVSEKKVKVSHMKIGSSPLYFLKGQESSLENFYQHLRSKEKEAFLLLKEKAFLRDSIQLPAIRVALREIRDFAIPFKSKEDVFWRYFMVPESEFKAAEEKRLKETKPEIVKEVKEEVKEIVKETKEEKEPEKPLEVKKPRERKKLSKKTGTHQKEKFLGQVKEFLAKKTLELKGIENLGKGEIVLRVLDAGQEKILVAFNKRKITDGDIIKAYKKAQGLSMPYMVFGLSEPSKKTSELIKAVKDLSSIHGLK